MEEEILDQALVDEFIVEFRERIEDAIHHALTIEKDPEDTESVNSLFRELHTIKGNAGVVGFKKMVRLAQETENLVGNIRDRILEVNSEIVEVLLTSADLFTALVDEAEGRATVEDHELNKFITTISSLSAT